MRLLFLLIWLIPGLAFAQSRTVLPDELELRVEVERTEHTPFVREMVLITIHGVYRRHITLEKLVQPDFAGFSWTQLGDDVWRETRINGEKVKTFRRRMAIYPDAPGTLSIGAFTHKLTLTDEGDDWFEHQITSEPQTIEVAPAPSGNAWWFPARGIRVSDEWSNAPDQLKSGEGVLRVIRVEALGATPEMIPPMPELSSPSGMIFPHPEQRFVELSPRGPVSFAYWRWTIRPGNDTSAIVEPLRFSYFDTSNRVDRDVTISAQRVAYGDAIPQVPIGGIDQAPPEEGSLPGWPLALLGMIVMAAGIALAVQGRHVTGLQALRRFALFDPMARQLLRAAQSGDPQELRRRAAALIQRDGPTTQRQALISGLDRSLFDPGASPSGLRDFARDFLRARPRAASDAKNRAL